jgi:hypothetical protein
MNPFSDFTVLGNMTPQEAINVLNELHDFDAEEELTNRIASQRQKRRMLGGLLRLDNIIERKWAHTAHTVGFISPTTKQNDFIKIIGAGEVDPDLGLSNKRIKITLNGLRVADYPGGSMHHILFDFYAQNQSINMETEHLHFNSIYRVQEGERAAVFNQPIFVGLNVGSEGVSFRCLTVNIRSEGDEKLLGFLENDVFKTGLKILDAVQPAVGQLSEMAIGLTKGIVERRRNVPVQDIYLGLDFSPTPGGVGLAEGAYVAVQIPERNIKVWDWDNWVFDPSSNRIVQYADHTQLIPYNYISFGVSLINLL